MAALPPGIFGGTIEGDGGGTFVLVTRDVGLWDEVDGYLFYGLDTSGPPKVGGLVQFKPGYWCGGSYVEARNGHQLTRGDSDSAVPPLYVHVTLDPAAPSLTGSIRTLGGAQPTRELTGGPIPGSTFAVKAQPNLVDIVGGWTMIDPLGTPSAFTIANDGRLAGTYRGCTVEGTIQPSADGANLFAVKLKAQACNTLAFLEDFVGFALAIPLAAGGTQLLLWAEATNYFDWSYVLAIGQ